MTKEIHMWWGLVCGVFVVLWLWLSCPPPPLPTLHVMYGLWDDGPLPTTYQRTINQWTQQGWTVKCWDRKQAEALMKRHPEFDALRHTFLRQVQWADLARYLIIWEEGGFYADLDARPLKPLRPYLTSSSQAFFFVETTITPEFGQMRADTEPIREGVPESCQRLANYFFGTRRPHHPALQRILQRLKTRCERFPERDSDYEILFKTGPDCLTSALVDAPDIRVLPGAPFVKHLATGRWRHRADQTHPARSNNEDDCNEDTVR